MRANPVIVPATEELALRMAPQLVVDDCRELRAGVSREEISISAVRESTAAWAWILDGEPACLFGVVPRSIMGSRTATVWLLATPAIRRDLRTFWLGSKFMVEHLLARFPRLEGFVDERFGASCRWVLKLGFKVGPPTSYGGTPLRYFVMER